MSDFRIKEPHLFVQLNQALQQIESISPRVLSGVKLHVEKNIKDIYVDIKETENEINDLKNQQRQAQQSAELQLNSNTSNESGTSQEHNQPEGPSSDELKILENQKNQKLQELKNALSTLEHLKIRFTTKETQFNKIISDSRNAKQILNAFYEIGMKYISFPNNNSNNSFDKNNQSLNENKFNIFNDVKRVADTFHFEASGSINQSKIDEIERNIKNSSEKGNKISIDNISQSDFTMLEKNGYTIQKIDANDYSAYKNVER